MTTIVAHASAAEFLERAEAWLMLREVEHTVVLGIAGRIAREPETAPENTFFATVERAGKVVGCAFRTPPFKLSVTRMPATAIPRLVEAVASRYNRLSAVLGPEPAVERFAQEWARSHDLQTSPGKRQRIYKLEQVRWPANLPPGAMRPAEPEDATLVESWIDSFARDVGMPEVKSADFAARRIADRSIFVWDDGEPRCLASWAATTAHCVRIGHVYTPDSSRGQGYASALVASVTQRALDAGFHYGCLYTDLANPTSNSIYQRIGYEPVTDVCDYHFFDRVAG